MIQAISMGMDDMKEILDALPEELRNKIMEQLKPDSGIGRIQEFVEQYEDNDIRDHIIAHTVSNLIRKIGGVSTEMMKERKKEGKKRVNTIEMGQIVIECLKDEAKNIQEALDSHNKDCKRGDDCGAKH
jgi:DNA-binding transcriptional ArsR family regulator